MQPIAHIENAYDTKFGIPRQPSLVEIESRIVFEPNYRVAEAVRGLEEFDYVWLIWQFSKALRNEWSPTVRPPRLGGNQRVGVFATRSPFRPNALGLSSVRLLRIEQHPQEGCVLIVGGADLMNGTPIYDIKPYLPYTDSHPEAHSSFATEPSNAKLAVECSDTLLHRLPEPLRQPLLEILALDPRPRYQNDSSRQYGMTFGNCEVHFLVDNGRLTVTDIESPQKPS
ncbi:MAG: tRNA (N6-threonylcarbamoyladenosine(37)-N6)-methyltransferase TrmO [Bacteroidales bacterium]|nr:tRNA (N6-threonylcarbamoyladenosine(37)-N6)-methyltransferase TrmO [Bacteroidales bacterium]